VGLALAALAHDTPAMHSVAQDALVPLFSTMEVRWLTQAAHTTSRLRRR
jgi:hypothetical protein